MATLFRRVRSRKKLIAYYYSRFIVPADLRPVLNRREIQKSLQTSCYNDARLLAAQWEGRIAGLFLHLRRNGQGMTPQQIRQLIQHHISERLEDWENGLYGGQAPAADSMSVVRDEDGEPSDAQWQDSLAVFSESTAQDCAQALKRNDLSVAVPLAQEFIKRHRLSIKADSDLYRFLCRELLKAEQVIAKGLQERVQGDYAGHDSAAYTILPPASLASDLPPVSTLALSEVTEAYLKHFSYRAKGTLRAKRDTLDRFMAVIGDGPLQNLTKKDCIRYRDTLGRLPVHMSKKYPGKSVSEVLEAVAQLPNAVVLSKQTVNQDLTHLRHFFSWAKDNAHYAGDNPVDGLAYAGVAAQHSDTFTTEDLSRIFGSQEYADQREDRPERYLLPLILLYSGARREEIAQLALGDIRQEGGVWFFDLKPDEARGVRLKNKASVRRVPIHPHLEAFGFFAFVNKRRATGEVALFPKPKNTGKGRATVGDAVGKWFSRHLERVGVSGKKSLHSFRSTVISALHARGVDAESRRALVGHSGVDVHEQDYLRLSLPVLRDQLGKLDFRSALKGLPVYK